MNIEQISVTVLVHVSCSAQLLVVTVQRAINQEDPTLLRVTSLLWR